MADVDYDPAAMRTAMKRLMDAYSKLGNRSIDVEMLPQTVAPGASGATTAFHQHLERCNQATAADHAESLKQVSNALNTLAAIDKQYNNSEIANELGFKHINAGRD